MNIIVKEVDYRHYQEMIQQIRTEVFVIEQSVPEDLEYDGRDEHCRHVLALDGDTVVATGRIDLSRDGKIGRVAVLTGRRRGCIGGQVMQALHRIARRAGLKQVRLNAQVSVLPFYFGLDYRLVGDSFMEANIAHQLMVRDLD